MTNKSNGTLASFSRKVLLASTALVAAGAMNLTSTTALADDPWDLTGTGFTKDTSLTNHTKLTQSGSRAYGEGDLDIEAYECVDHLFQGNKGDLLYRQRLRKNDPTKILGALNADGRVMVLDKNGVFFGADSRIDVGSIIASTGDINKDAVMAGADVIEFTNLGDASIVNDGQITVGEAGIAAFVAPTVINNGVINAKMGRVAFAAGDQVTLDFYGDSLVEVAASEGLENALLENAGTINAEGGVVQMTARAANEAVDSIINMDGVINASSATVQGGKIILDGGESGLVTVSQDIRAKGAGNVGGSVEIIAEVAELDAAIEADDVSGDVETVNILSADAKINDGIKIGSEGATINVAAGTYNESVNANKAGQTLNGANAGSDGYNFVFGRDPETIVSPNSPGFYVTADNVTIDGFEVNGGNIGVHIDGAKNAVVKNNYIHGQRHPQATGTQKGFRGSGDGILITASNGVEISNNFVEDTDDESVEAAGSLNINIINNTLDNWDANIFDGGIGNGDFTVSFRNVKNGLILNNTLAAGSFGGVEIFEGSNNLVVENGIIGQGKNYIADGVLLNETEQASLFDNFVFNLGGDGIKDINSVNFGNFISGNEIAIVRGTGIFADNADNLGVASNTINSTGSNGMTILNSNDIDVVFNNIGLSEGNNNIQGDGIYLDNIDGADIWANTITNTTSTATDIGSGINLKNSDNISIGSEDFRGLFPVGVGNVVYNTALDGVRLENVNNVSVYDTDIDDVQNAGISVIKSLDTLISSGSIDGTGSHGITVSNSRNTTVESVDIGINSGANNINGDGIYTIASNNAMISGNTITNTTSTDADIGSGVQILNSRGSMVRNNTIYNTEWDGVRLENVSDTIVARNDIDDVQRSGIFVGGLNKNIAINENQIDGVALGNGIRALYTNNLNIIGNRINDTAMNGVLVENSGPSLRVNLNNIGIHGGDIGENGIEIRNSGSGNVISNNIANAADNGIYVNNSNGTQVKENDIFSVGANGILVNPSNDVDVIGNDIDSTGLHGVKVIDSNNATVSGNDIGLDGGDNNINGDGILAVNSDDFTAQGNEISNTTSTEDNIGSGIQVLDSNDIQIGGLGDGEGNTIYNTEWDGIRLERVSNVIAEGNDIDDVQRSGIFVGGSSKNIALNINDINGVALGNGIRAIYSQNLNITGNTIDNTFLNGIIVENNAPSLNVDLNVIGSADGNIGQNGIKIQTSSGGSISANTIQNTTLSGIHIEESNRSLVNRNTINTVGKDGVRIEGGTDNIPEFSAIITNNTVDNAGDNGIVVENLNEFTIDGNIINNVGSDSSDDDSSEGNGIEATFYGNGQITNNVINNVGNDGIFVDGHNDSDVGFSILIDNNDIDNAGGDGIDASYTNQDTITNNDVSNADEVGILVGDDNGNVTFTGNTMSNNPVGARFNSGIVNMIGASNTFNGGEVGLQFDGEEVSLSDNDPTDIYDGSIGTSVFNGQSGFFVELTDGALFQPGQPGFYNGLDATYSFDGGSFSPSSTGGLVSQAQFDFLESKFQHFPDLNDLGLFFFGAVPLAVIDQEDIFNTFGAFDGDVTGASVTITGLPTTTPTQTAALLNNLTPAAGGEGGELTPEELANIDPAAGGDSVGCWNDAMNGIDGGATVTYSFDSSLEAGLDDTAGCGASQDQ